MSRQEKQRSSYEIEFFIPAPRREVFDFVSNVENLDRMTPDWLRFEVRSPLPVEVAHGVTVDYRLRWRRVPLRWRSLITVWEPETLFTYEQRLGPYRCWIHEHRFEDAEGGTRVVDRVDYSVYGELFVGRWVASDIETIFKHRINVLERELGAQTFS